MPGTARAWLAPVAVVIALAAVVGTLPTSSGVSSASPVLPRQNAARDGNALVSSNIQVPALLWTYATGALATTSPLVADIDSDGQPDVVFGEVRTTPAGMGSRHVYALEADGTLKWMAPTKYDVGVRAVVDLEGDGSMEVIASEGCHCQLGGLFVYVLNGEDGSLQWSKSINFWGMGHEGTFASPEFLDINGDGVLDMIFTAMDRFTYAFDGLNGNTLWQSAQFTHYVRTSPAMADFDGDGDLEVVAVAESGLVRAMDAKTGATMWEFDYGNIAAATPAIGELDGDPLPEIVFPLVGWYTGFIEPGRTVAVNAEDGSILWSNAAYDSSYRGPALVDIDGDSLADVIDGDSDSAIVVAYKGTTGQVLWTTPMPASAWASGPFVVTDIDADGKKEVLAGSDAGLVVMNSATGAIEWSYAATRVRGEPWVADLTGDGHGEVLFSAGDGKIYALTQRPPAVFAPHTIGYWKHQCSLATGIPAEWAMTVGTRSTLFAGLTTKAQVCNVLKQPTGNDMLARARQQLMALWLNVASGKVSDYKTISLPAYTTAGTVLAAILECETILLNPSSPRSEQERAKNIADQLNNGKGG